MRRRLLVLVLFASLGAAGQSQAPPVVAGQDSRPGNRPTETAHVVVETSFAAGPRGRVSLFVDIAPKPKMHVYAPQQKDYIPVTLTVQPNPTLKFFPPVFPKPEKYFFAPLKETQLVYSKPFRIVQEIALATMPAANEPAKTGDGAITISGTLRYQACDDAICYLPKELPVSWTVTVKGLKR